MAPVSGAPGRVPDRLGQCGRDLGGVGAQRGADGVRTGVFGAHRHRDRPRTNRCGHRHQRAHRALVPEPHLTYVRDPDRSQQTARRLRPVPQCGRRDGDRPVECQEVQLRVERAQHHRHLVPGTSRHQIPAEGGPPPDPLGGDAAPARGQTRQGGPHPGIVRAGVMIDPGADLQRRAVPLDGAELGYALQRHQGPAVETLAEPCEEIAAALCIDRTAGAPAATASAAVTGRSRTKSGMVRWVGATIPVGSRSMRTVPPGAAQRSITDVTTESYLRTETANAEISSTWR